MLEAIHGGSSEPSVALPLSLITLVISNTGSKGSLRGLVGRERGTAHILIGRLSVSGKRGLDFNVEECYYSVR